MGEEARRNIDWYEVNEMRRWMCSDMQRQHQELTRTWDNEIGEASKRIMERLPERRLKWSGMG